MRSQNDPPVPILNLAEHFRNFRNIWETFNKRYEGFDVRVRFSVNMKEFMGIGITSEDRCVELVLLGICPVLRHSVKTRAPHVQRVALTSLTDFFVPLESAILKPFE